MKNKDTFNVLGIGIWIGVLSESCGSGHHSIRVAELVKVKIAHFPSNDQNAIKFLLFIFIAQIYVGEIIIDNFYSTSDLKHFLNIETFVF